MKIGIIGGGSLGLLFSGYLARHFTTTLYARREEQLKLLKEKGITVKRDKGDFTSTPNIKHVDNDWTDDLMIVAVKQPSLKPLIDKLHQKVGENQAILFLQNGMGHVAYLSGLHHHHIYLGVVEHGAKRLSDNEVIQNGFGMTRIAAYKGHLSRLSALFSESSFKFVREPQWRSMLTEKLMINAVINPLTALYRVENGQLTENSHVIKNMRTLYEETAEIMRVDEIEKGWDKLISICGNTRTNRSSMLQDLDAERATEIEAISGYIIREAERLNKPYPLTRFLYHSILAAEGQVTS